MEQVRKRQNERV